METINDYLEQINEVEHRFKLEGVINYIKDKYNLDFKIGWNQPMLTDHGTYIIGFSVAKNHFSIGLEARNIELFKNDISVAGYDYSKMLFKIKWNQEVNYQLIDKIVEYTIKDKQDIKTFWYK